MAVTVIDPGEGALARGIASIGEALAFRSRRKELKFEELQRTGQIQKLSASFRAAKKAGTEGTFLESLGLDERFARFF